MNLLESPVSIIIFIATVSISLWAMYKNQNLYYSWMLSPTKVYYEKKYYQLITSGFLHADLMHLLFNMMTFYFFVFRLEASIGGLNFLIIYFGSMIGGNIYTVFKKKEDYGYGSVGASGAISGVLFSSILIDPTFKIGIFPIPFPLPSWLFGILFLTWTYFAAQKSFDRINHDAHFYGAIAGVILTIILIPGVLSNFIHSF